MSLPTIKGMLSLDDLVRKLPEVLDGVVRNGDIWELQTSTSKETYILGPPSLCSHVLGLVDPEYGWPIKVQLDSQVDATQLQPRNRYHPVLCQRQREVAWVIRKCEF